MEFLLEKLLRNQNRESTNETYLRIWRQFNKFVISLDRKPNNWEDRTSLYVCHMVYKGMQSSSIKSYVSAIKRILVDDGYDWKDEKLQLTALTKACRPINDRVRTRLPINCSLLELILFEFQRILDQQGYLLCLYQAIFALGYYGLMRVGELTYSSHVMKAENIHVATNKDKILIVLYTSKTHGKANRPQKIRITSNRGEKTGSYLHRNFCPFKLLQQYVKLRDQGDQKCNDGQEQFFVFSDGSPVHPVHVRQILK